jgi:UTP:GlnB (protein PII) uridylyltransferase
MPDVVLTKLFDVRNANGAVDGATTYPQATIVAFKDATARTNVLDAFALMGSYQDVIDGAPNPQTKQQFFNKELQQFIKDRVRQARDRTAQAAAAAAAVTTDLP